METVWQPRSTIFVEVPTNSISTMLIKGIHRVNGIALGLTHLLAVFILNVTQNNYVLIG